MRRGTRSPNPRGKTPLFKQLTLQFQQFRRVQPISSPNKKSVTVTERKGNERKGRTKKRVEEEGGGGGSLPFLPSFFQFQRIPSLPFLPRCVTFSRVFFSRASVVSDEKHRCNEARGEGYARATFRCIMLAVPMMRPHFNEPLSRCVRLFIHIPRDVFGHSLRSKHSACMYYAYNCFNRRDF